MTMEGTHRGFAKKHYAEHGWNINENSSYFKEVIAPAMRAYAIAFRNYEPPVGSYSNDEQVLVIYEKTCR
jgi:hypothetical protein